MSRGVHDIQIDVNIAVIILSLLIFDFFFQNILLFILNVVFINLNIKI
ncbi:hypothetical protein BGAPBR_I0012 (plasmid) [Borreliella garinii PBr]|uniref:Uncharacterized protein n=1 Tax=Borreliella garinii PBr TaxID=498743 RepID=B8F0Z1_BORGR|nr:hypothetical protein BGAPBR_I0012 [Borreliella garinii PBr]